MKHWHISVVHPPHFMVQQLEVGDLVEGLDTYRRLCYALLGQEPAINVPLFVERAKASADDEYGTMIWFGREDFLGIAFRPCWCKASPSLN